MVTRMHEEPNKELATQTPLSTHATKSLTIQHMLSHITHRNLLLLPVAYNLTKFGCILLGMMKSSSGTGPSPPNVLSLKGTRAFLNQRPQKFFMGAEFITPILWKQLSVFWLKSSMCQN